MSITLPAVYTDRMSLKPTIWIEVSKSAFEHNVRTVRALTRPETKLMAVVKSNAYGHGLVATAKIFTKAGADWLGVFSIDEAIELRKKGVRAPILVMGPTDIGNFKTALRYKLRVTIYDRSVLQNTAIKISAKLPIHIKIDTGLSRQGVPMERVQEFFGAIPRGLTIEGIYSHLADPEDFEKQAFSRFQSKNFETAIEIARNFGYGKLIKHLVASDGLLSFPQGEFDMVRVGLFLYGLWPSDSFQKQFKSIQLQPALSWKTRIAQVKKIPKGAYVGYGITERMKHDTIIAVVPIGYWDGYPRSLSSRGVVLVGGKRCRVLGRISMNMTVVDATDAGVVHAGDEAVLIGRQGESFIGAEELAEFAGTISHEIVTRINPLLPRIVVQ